MICKFSIWSLNMINILLLLICFARMVFTKQYHGDETSIVRMVFTKQYHGDETSIVRMVFTKQYHGDETSIVSKTHQR